MSKRNNLSKDEAKLIFGGAQTGSNSSDNNVNETMHCSCPYINKSSGVTNENSALGCSCECVSKVTTPAH
jgi:hypothetical protein